LEAFVLFFLPNLGPWAFVQLAKGLALPHILSFNQSCQAAIKILYIFFPLNLFQRQASFTEK
jgi:hypothetical protein